MLSLLVIPKCLYTSAFHKFHKNKFISYNSYLDIFILKLSAISASETATKKIVQIIPSFVQRIYFYVHEHRLCSNWF